MALRRPERSPRLPSKSGVTARISAGVRADSAWISPPLAGLPLCGGCDSEFCMDPVIHRSLHGRSGTTAFGAYGAW